MTKDSAFSGKLLYMQHWNFGLQKQQGISGLAERLLACQEGFCYTELVNHMTSYSVTGHYSVG